MYKLQEADLIKELDGSLGGYEDQLKLQKLITENFNVDYEYTILTDYDYFDGLPLLHNQRKIVLSRLRKMKVLDKSNSDKIKAFKFIIEARLTSAIKVDFEFQTIDEISDKAVYGISVSWTPNINESTAESLQKYKEDIIRYFDEIFPRVLVEKNYSDCKEVLMYEGEIRFEGEK